MRPLVTGIAFLAMMGLAAPMPATAADPERDAAPAVAFGTPVRVLAGEFLYGMDMGVDAAGRLHLVASGFHSGKAGLWYATNRSGAWVAKRILRWSDGVVWVHPAIALDVNGRVHIAVEKAGCVECTIAPAKGIFHLGDVGRTRGTFPATPTRLTPVGTAQPSLRVDAGRRFLAYAGNPDHTAVAVKLRTWGPGGMTTSTVVPAGQHPFLRIGSDGRPRVVAEVATGLRWARATTLTGGFVTSMIPGTTGADEQPAVSIDEDGGAHVTWRDTDGGLADPPGIRYVNRIPGGWSPVASVASGWIHALSIDAPRKPWVAVGGADLVAYRPAGAMNVFSSVPVDDGPVLDVAIKVLDSGKVVVAWAGGSPLGLWVART